MDSFLDTNIIINFVNHNKEHTSNIISKCYSYINNQKGKILVCYAVICELHNIMKLRSIVHKEVLKKLEDENHNFDISKRDIPYAEKLYLAYKEENKEKLAELFASERDIFEIEIERFLKNRVNIRVISIEQIDGYLVANIHDIIYNNHADCKILASALQYQKDKELFLFVTADKDFDPSRYEYLKEHFKINHSSENYKFPKLKNLLFEK